MERSDYEKLIHIRDYCHEIRKTLERYGESFQIYILDRDFQRSLAFSILQIGELSGHLSEEYRKTTASAIQWSPIKGMRNAVVHGYGEIDHKVIWDTATIDVPVLLNFCDKQLQAYQPQQDGKNIAEAVKAFGKNNQTAGIDEPEPG